MSSQGETRQAARALRRARVVAVALFLTAVAGTIALALTDEGFVNLICDFEDPEAYDRDPSGIPECKEPFSPEPWMTGIVGLATGIAAVWLTIAIHPRTSRQP